jgi:hypothetical protein
MMQINPHRRQIAKNANALGLTAGRAAQLRPAAGHGPYQRELIRMELTLPLTTWLVLVVPMPLVLLLTLVSYWAHRRRTGR